MPIYKDGQRLHAFKGDYAPVNIYKGDKKVTGWKPYEQSGEHLSIENTYNDKPMTFKILGDTVEIGEGEKSPDNTYELRSVGDDGGFDLVSAGRNLFYYDSPSTHSSYGMTWVFNEDQTMTINGASTASTAQSGKTLNTFVKKGVTYTLKVEHVSGSVSGNFGFLVRWTSGSGFRGTYFQYGWGAVDFTPDADSVLGCGPYLYSNSVAAELVLRVMIVRSGEPVTPYTPFRGMQSIHIPYTLRGQGDVRDTVEYVGNGIWEYVQRRGVMTLNGSEGIAWGVSQPSRHPDMTYMYSSAYNMVIPLATVVVSDKFESFYNLNLSSNTDGKEAIGSELRSSAYRLRVFILKSRLTEVSSAGFNQWLAENPVTVEYDLTTPADPIYFTTEELRTFYPYTQYYTVGTDIQPTLEGKFRVMGGQDE